MGDYGHKRELQGDSALWHKIVLLDGVFGKTKDNLSDMRVFGITENGDTIEAPYLLEIDRGKTESNNVNFKLINQSRDKRGYYFTFELPAEKNEFDFQEKVLQNIKITIQNYDNEALKIGDIGAKAAVHYLTARFSKPARYYLVYGNPNANKPHYDIGHFSDKIPDNPTNLQVGEEKPIYKNNPPKTEALFKNKTWLWAVMAIVVLLLGWFSISMIKKK